MFRMVTHLKNQQALAKNVSFFTILATLHNPVYQLMDPIPKCCKAYSIAVAIPIMSCTAERLCKG